MDTIRVKALAKINISLDVLNKLENGYHELLMVMQSINLHDTVIITKTIDPSIKISTNKMWLPTNHKNIAYQAAELFLKETSTSGGVYIDILKRIPISAGLGGGSSDAAAVLVGLNKLAKTHLTKKELMKIGVNIGADVPFCILRGTALAEGIGEKLTILPTFPQTYILLAKPNVNVSTKSVFKELVLSNIKKHPNTDKILLGINTQNKNLIYNNMYNVLETITGVRHPKILDIKQEMLSLGAINSLMSGSGPTVFGIFDDEETCSKAAKKIKSHFNLKEVFVTSTYLPNVRKEQ
ncbi:MAG: 4-(cytidine 5'-diphospho)-2-C-methyl-D-erythritol kinase [Candidatus Epulonipiscioides saccharophilum]|nr:MAG: 4-(cytidine 5'-diphospho)-2-C-methyl-D-erythritol kinase [Epulopiscium sp. AS2M-Bin001]